MPRRSDTKERLLDASAQLFRRQGYWGTGLVEVTETGQAPWGSLYHYFPGGKEQLGVEALERSGSRYQHLIASVFSRHTSVTAAVKEFFELMIDSLEKSGFADGCPIATVTVDVASRSEALRQACSTAFSAWTEQLTEYFEPTFGAASGRLAVFALSTFEGAMVLSRAHHDITPLRVACELLVAALDAAISGGTQPR